MRFSVFVSAALLAGASVACGGSDEQPQDASNFGQCPPGQFCNNAQTTGATTGGYGGATPQPTATTPPPAGAGGATAGGSTATPLPGAAMLTPLITAAAQAEVQGMQAEGPAFAGQFQEGQTLEQPFNINAGKCYSVVGASIGPTELDVEIVFHVPPAPPLKLAQDNQNGGMAVVGGKGACFKNPTMISGPGKVIVRATKGAGIAGAQIYVK